MKLFSEAPNTSTLVNKLSSYDLQPGLMQCSICHSTVASAA